MFNDERDIVTAAYNQIIDNLKNNEKIRYIKCPKNHFYDENLKKCPECEGDELKNLSEKNPKKNEQDLIDELNNAALNNIGTLRIEAFRRGDIASEFVFQEIENATGTKRNKYINFFDFSNLPTNRQKMINSQKPVNS